MELKDTLKDLVFNKSELKQTVYNATKDTFEIFREETRELIMLFKPSAQRWILGFGSLSQSLSAIFGHPAPAVYSRLLSFDFQ